MKKYRYSVYTDWTCKTSLYDSPFYDKLEDIKIPEFPAHSHLTIVEWAGSEYKIIYAGDFASSHWMKVLRQILIEEKAKKELNLWAEENGYFWEGLEDE